MTTNGSHKASVPVCFPFIVGCGRSGTTMLRAMLDSHPDIAVPAETKFIARMGASRHRYERTGGFAIEPFIEDMYRLTALEARWDLPRDVTSAALAAEPPQDYPDAVRRVFATMARRRGKPRYGNKTPIHVMTIPMLAELFPEARFVHLIRDGRDVAMSYMDTEFGPNSVIGGALHWKRHVRKGRVAGARLGSGRYYELRYEDLVDDPELELRSLCSFLDLEYQDSMLAYYTHAGDVLEGIKLPQYHSGLKLPPTRRMRDWRTAMGGQDVARFEAIAGSLLAELSYERAFPRLAPHVALAARWEASLEEGHRLAGAVSRRLSVGGDSWGR